MDQSKNCKDTWFLEGFPHLSLSLSHWCIFMCPSFYKVWLRLVIWCYMKGSNVMIDRSSSSMRVYWRDVETLARKQRHQLKMAALASRIFWLNFSCSGRKWRCSAHLYICQWIWRDISCGKKGEHFVVSKYFRQYFLSLGWRLVFFQMSMEAT